MIFTKFDKTNLSTFRQKFDKMLSDFHQETGVALKIGNIRYDENSFRTTLQGFVQSVSGDGPTPDKIEWDRVCVRYGLKPEHFGETIDLGFGRSYKLVGIKSRNRKYPIIGEKDNGQRYKLTLQDAKTGLGI